MFLCTRSIAQPLIFFTFTRARRRSVLQKEHKSWKTIASLPSSYCLGSKRSKDVLVNQDSDEAIETEILGFPIGNRKMGSKLIDLPMKFLLPSSFENIKEFSLKTIPSVTKVEIKSVLETMCGFEVEKVRTLNMQGKKKRRGSRLVSRPNYKKAYVTLKKPISSASHLQPFRSMEEELLEPYEMC